MKNLLLLLISVISLSCYSQEEIVSNPDEIASYKGGTIELKKYLVNNLDLSNEALQELGSSRVFIEFFIESDGEISEVNVLNPVPEEVKEEAIRLFMNMPNWNPAMKDDKAVKSKLIFPLNFSGKTKK